MKQGRRCGRYKPHIRRDPVALLDRKLGRCRSQRNRRSSAVFQGKRQFFKPLWVAGRRRWQHICHGNLPILSPPRRLQSATWGRIESNPPLCFVDDSSQIALWRLPRTLLFNRGRLGCSCTVGLSRVAARVWRRRGRGPFVSSFVSFREFLRLWQKARSRS